MHTRTLIHTTLALSIALALSPASRAFATQPSTPPRAGSLLHEIPDPELAALRGRFIVGNNTVAYFGVTMASSWTTASGEVLNGSALLGMHFNPGGQAPVVSFTPTLTIVRGAAAPALDPPGSIRSVDGSGLVNVTGLVQGIQVAGDGNRAVNVTSLRIGNATGTPATDTYTPATGAATASVSQDASHVAVAFDPARGVSLTLGVDGQGLVSQWIRSGSVGQLVQLTADGQTVSNQLRLDLVLGHADPSSQALRAASEALLQSRLAATGTGG